MVLSAPALAGGIVSLTWDGCTGPLTKTVSPGSTAKLFASVIGEQTTLIGYLIRIRVSADCSDPTRGGGVPDAWRFDPAGCQGSQAPLMAHFAPIEVVATCANFVSPPAFTIQITEYKYDALLGQAQITFANVFTPTPATPDPTRRYFITQIAFDQAHGVRGESPPYPDCGGLEVPMCMQLIEQEYADVNSNIIPWARANECVSVNDTQHRSGCDAATPVRATTWGAVRGRYR
jgi:hypothetical protein